MSERWVKATGDYDGAAFWINAATADRIEGLADGTTRLWWRDYSFEVKEPPEHFLPVADLALVFAVDALKEINTPGRSNGAAIAEAALANIFKIKGYP